MLVRSSTYDMPEIPRCVWDENGDSTSTSAVQTAHCVERIIGDTCTDVGCRISINQGKGSTLTLQYQRINCTDFRASHVVLGRGEESSRVYDTFVAEAAVS